VAYGRAFWEPLVAEVEGGESVKAVATRHGVAISALNTWRQRLRGERRTTALLPVRLSTEIGARVEIEVDGLRVVLRDAAPDYVVTLVRALGTR